MKTQFLSRNQGNLKGESVMVAILPSRMEASYCISGFFCSLAHQAILLTTRTLCIFLNLYTPVLSDFWVIQINTWVNHIWAVHSCVQDVHLLCTSMWWIAKHKTVSDVFMHELAYCSCAKLKGIHVRLWHSSVQNQGHTCIPLVFKWLSIYVAFLGWN